MNVDAAQCLRDKDDSNQMQNRSGPWSVHITPRGFSLNVKLEIALECEYNVRTRLLSVQSKNKREEKIGLFTV